MSVDKMSILKATIADHSAESGCVVCLALDGLDSFRREYGYVLGDQVLNHVESVASEVLEAVLLIRTEDDQFLALIVAGRDGTQARTDHLRQRIAGSRLRFTVDGNQIAHSMTISAGIAPYDSPAPPLSDLLSHSTMACVSARQQTDSVVVYADRDNLTGLPTGRALAALLEDTIAGASPEKPISVLQLDIDGFGAYNEGAGRDAGDRLLVALASEFSGISGDTGTVGRLWADEFLVILPGCRAEDAAYRAEAARRTLAESTGSLGEISLSIGVATYPRHAADAWELVRKGREARFQSRESGGGRTTVAEADQMVTKTSHFSRIQLKRLAALARAQDRSEAAILREGLDGLLQLYDDGAPEPLSLRHPLE